MEVFMFKEKTKNTFVLALFEIYNLDIINVLLKFLQGEQAVLFAIKYNENLTATDLAQKLAITKSRVTSIISSLVNKNYLKVSKDPSDLRKQKISLTEEGNKFIIEKENEANQLLEHFYLKMGEKDIKVLTKLLFKTSQIMKEVNSND